MLKKITAFICSFLVILLACSAAFLSSAVVDSVKLPFPNPQLFEKAPVIVFHTDNDIWYMCVFDEAAGLYPTAGSSPTYNTLAENLWVLCSEHSVKATLSKSYAFHLNPLLFRWSSSRNFYSVSRLGNFNADTAFGTEYTVYSSSSRILDEFHCFNCQRQLGDNSYNPDYNYSISFSDSIDENDLISINSYLETNELQVSSIILYLDEILHALGVEDYSEPASSTENEQMSDYEEAERAISDDAFNNLDNFEFEGIGDSLNSFGNGFSGALSFLSSNMEFFTGNQTSSYGSNDDDSAIRKISVVILIVLSLGLVSFVLNLVSSKGSD